MYKWRKKGAISVAGASELDQHHSKKRTLQGLANAAPLGSGYMSVAGEWRATNMNQRRIALIFAIGVLNGCATASKDLTATYVSPLQYQSYDCTQIAAESQRIQARVTQLGGRLDEAANNDKGIAVVGAVLFWPILFALGGTKQQEAEYSRLRGEYDAIQQEAIAKKCPSAVPAPAPSVVAAPTPTPSVGDVPAPAPSVVAVPVSLPVPAQ